MAQAEVLSCDFNASLWSGGVRDGAAAEGAQGDEVLYLTAQQ